jgi:hypothetical protein
MVGGYQEAEIDFTADKSRPNPAPLPSAASHGLWLHVPVRVCVTRTNKALLLIRILTGCVFRIYGPRNDKVARS